MNRLEYTISEIYRLAAQYKNDVAKYNLKTVQEIFDYVKDIPFVRDIDSTGYDEYLRRPKNTVEGGDCDDKTIFALAALTLIDIPARVVTTSYKPDGEMQHVYLDVLDYGTWKPFDATYSTNKLFYEKPYTKKIGWSTQMEKQNLGVRSLEGYNNLGFLDPISITAEVAAISAAIGAITKLWSSLFGGSGSKTAMVTGEQAHQADLNIRAKYVEMVNSLSSVGRQKFLELVASWEAEHRGRSTSFGRHHNRVISGWDKLIATYPFKDAYERACIILSYPVFEILVASNVNESEAELRDNYTTNVTNNILNPLKKFYSESGDSDSLTEDVIPGVNNLWLLAGAAAALLLFSKKGRR